MKKVCSLITLAFLLGSCASLTKKQVEAVNQFAETSRKFSAYPSTIMTALADVRLKRGVYYTSIFYTDPSAYIGSLDDVYNEKKVDYKLSAKVDITFQIIDQYAQSLALLSSDKYTSDLNKHANTSGTNIDSLISMYNGLDGTQKIPPGIGDLIRHAIVFGGNAYIKTKQAKQIKAFVPKADTLVAIMTANLTEFLNGKVYIKTINDSASIRSLIANERSGFKEGYKFYLASCARLKVLPTIDSENDYLHTLHVLDGIDTLLDQTIRATDGLRAAHKQLLKAIEQKKRLKESIAALQSYCEDVRNIQTTLEFIHTHQQ
jgi:hypothetical protein